MLLGETGLLSFGHALSIVSALPDVKIAGRIANPMASAIHGAACRAKAAERAGCVARGGALTTSVATSLNFGSMLDFSVRAFP